MKDTYDHRIPDLIIDYTGEGLIELRQQNGLEEPSLIELHPMHVRLMAEKLGLQPQQTIPADVTLLTERMQQRDKMIDRFKRDMLRMRDKAVAVQKAIANGDWDHADLSFEMGQANALVDVCDMAVDDFVDDFKSDDGKLAPGVLWEGSNGGRQMDAGAPVVSAVRPPVVTRDAKGTPAAVPRGKAGTGQLALEVP